MGARVHAKPGGQPKVESKKGVSTRASKQRQKEEEKKEKFVGTMGDADVETYNVNEDE